MCWEVAQDTAHAAAQEQSLQAYLRAVGQAAHRASDRDLAITVLLTEECSTCQALKEQFDQLRGLAPLRAVCGVDRVWEMAALRRFAALPHRLRLSRLIIEVCECYRERAFLNYMKALQNCSRVIPVVAPGADDDLKKALADFVYRSTRCAVQPNQSLREWIQSLEEHGEQMLGEKAKDASQKQGVIGQVIALIDQNYMSDIGVGQIARQLHIAPNYLSALFRKETGVTFMEYLTQTRMWRAKELLTDPDVQVQEVAQQVGYSSPRYFSRRFFKHFGCYPSECRDQLKEGRPVRE